MNLYILNPKTNIQLAPTPFAAGGKSELYNLLSYRSVIGFVDVKGNEVIPFIYDDAYDFRENSAGVQKNGKWGFIDAKGNEVIPFVYDFTAHFSDGLAVVTKDGKEFLIDKIGKMHISD